MTQDIEKIKVAIAERIYRMMYRSNYYPSSEEVEIVSSHTSSTNKRALAIALKEKSEELEVGDYCMVAFENVVSKEDNLLNMKALSLDHNKFKPLTSASTRTK